MSISENPNDLVQVIDSLMNELDQLANTPSTSSNELFQRVSETVTAVCQPESFGIFILGPDRIPFNATGSEEGFEAYFPEPKAAIAELESASEGYVSSSQGQSQAVAIALRNNESVEGVMVARSSPETFSNVVLSVLKAIGELLSRFVANQLDAATSETFFKRLNGFSMGCMSTLNARELAKVIANDSRLLMDCERVQVFEQLSGRLSLSAVSSVAIFEKRTELLRASTRLAKSVLRENKPLLSSQGDLDAKKRSALDEYLALSGMTFCAFLPLRALRGDAKRVRPSGVLLAEFTAQPRFFEFARAANAVVPQASLAINNARRVSSVPFFRALMFLGNSSHLQGLVKFLIFLLIPAVLILSAFVIPAEHKIRVNGTLRAVVERQVFAPHDAFVQTVMVGHGQPVSEGQLLIELRSPELELELESAVGEIQKLRKFKAAKEIALNQATTGNAADRATQAKLASEIADLEFQISAEEDKRDHAKRQMDELQIFSPIDGKIVTWDAKKLLHEKPVRWGDPLLKIADDQSAWELRFKASENKVGYILNAARDRNVDLADLEVEYFFQSNPDQKFSTRIRESADSTEMDAEFGPSVALKCDTDPSQELKRHGARVVGDVDCGDRSIAFVWTYELIDAIRRQFVW